MKSGTKVILVSPPPTDPTQSYSSLPALTAYLRERGFAVVQRDLGVELFDEIMSPEWLRKSAKEANKRAESERKSAGREQESYLSDYFKIVGFSDYLIENVNRAKKLMKDQAGLYDIKSYQWAVNILHMSCNLASLPYYPTKVLPSNYISKTELTFEGLLEEVRNRKFNFYAGIFEAKILRELLYLDPFLIGISVTYKFQMVPAFTLAWLLKKAAPETHITMGGATLSRMDSHILRNPGFFDFADSYVIGEGETALYRLAEAISREEVPLGIPNCIVNPNGRRHVVSLGNLEDVNELPCPDFDGLDFERYFSPEPVLLAPTSRGCYHGRCAFCDVSRNTRSRYRSLKKKRLVQNLLNLRKRYGAKRFFFTDDAMPPAHMREIACLVKEDLPDVTWQGEARFEKMLSDDFIKGLRDGGCRQLIFGLESVSQRILDLMEKRNTFGTDLRILDSCFRYGIAVNLQSFIGFPTERREEALLTIDFLLENEHLIASVGFGTFALYEGTPIYKNPLKFSIEKRDSSLSASVLSPYFYEPLEGMTAKDIQELHAEGLNRILEVYETRTRYLGGASGAHSLLHFSHYRYPELYLTWSGLDRPKWNADESLCDVVPIVSPSVRIFQYPDGSCGPMTVVFCADSGLSYDFYENEKTIFDLCDGIKPAGEIASIWAGARHAEPGEEIIFLSRGMVMLREMLRMGLLTTI